MVSLYQSAYFLPQVSGSQNSCGTEPSSVQESLHNPKWKEAMDLEFETFQRNGTWKFSSILTSNVHCETQMGFSN